MPAQAAKPVYEALIIGTGFGGLGMAIALRRQGVQDFVVLEKAHDVGGVWRDNRYPGAACDVPSHLYSFSFEANPDWSHVFARQPEILAYLQHCARHYDLHRHIRFGAEVASAAYDEAQAVWTVTLTNGDTLSARLLITATGQLSRPVMARLPGLENFAGRSFHSAQWDHEHDLTGRRVAVVGTGASAIQFVPAIADRVGQLTVFQRSAAYVLPRGDRPYAPWEKARFRHSPWTRLLHRAGIYLKYESQALAFTRFKALMIPAGLIPFRRQLAQQVPDVVLRAKLTPDYSIGCKRILLSSDYLQTMARPNVEVVTEGIARVVPDGIETTDGRLHRVDTLIHGTGFAATDFLAPMRITGAGGQDLHQAWGARGAQAYLGLTVPGFPNFFMLYGPNTNLGHNSIVHMLESQILHVMRCRQALQAAGARSIEVQRGPFERYNARIQQRLASTVWSGCRSWYVDAAGHNSANWPGFTISYRWMTRRGSLKKAYRLHA